MCGKDLQIEGPLSHHSGLVEKCRTSILYQTRNFRLVQFESSCRRQLIGYEKLELVLGRVENILITSNFSFSHNVFKKALSSGSLKVGKEFNPFPNRPFFMFVQFRSFENMLKKVELSCNKQFLLFP